MTPAKKPDPSRRTTVSELAKLMAERRNSGSSSVSLRRNAQGMVQPDVTVVAGESQDVLDALISQAVQAFRRLEDEFPAVAK